MCIPAAAVAIGATILSTAVGAIGQIQQGNTAEKIAQRNATLQTQQGEYEARQIERRVRYIQGDATAQAGANGIGLTGSFLDVLADNAIAGEIDAENARRAGRNAAGTSLAQGRSAKSKSRYSAVGTLIGGASRAYGQYDNYMGVAA